MMHLIVVKRELVERQPEIVKAVYQGFKDIKAACEEKIVRGMTFNNVTTMIPWLTALISENRKVLGADWWLYGSQRNRAALDTFLRYPRGAGAPEASLDGRGRTRALSPRRLDGC
jgi:4,5-dihydroxyphthalate decarboxylase